MAVYYRKDWAAAPPKKSLAPLHDVPNGVLHHIGGGNAYPSNVVATLQQIQASEQHGEYVDIAYNWGVDKDGNLWELRGDVQDGATLGFAGSSFSVLAICNASAPDFVPSMALLSGIATCFKQAQDRGVLAHACRIDGHHVFDATQTKSPTACPGELEQHIPDIRAAVAGAPVPPKVQPMYNPPLVGSLVASLTAPNGGCWLLARDGSVYGVGKPVAAPYYGGTNGQPYFTGRTAADLRVFGGGYTIVASSGETYDFPAK